MPACLHPADCINPRYLRPAAVKRIRRAFRAAKPFPHIVLRDFLLPEHAQSVRRMLLRQRFERRESDLFAFSQTPSDLRTALPDLAAFFNTSLFLEYIELLTGVRGLASADLTGFVYGRGDHLLPHDDRLEGRRVAYILNLSEGFAKADGGALSLFATRGHRPTRIAKSITPTPNTLALFTVSRNSFHQVDEILADKQRISIAGWFHGARKRARR